MVASVQLPLIAVFFCLAEVVSHVILWRQCSRSMAVGIQCIWEWQPSYGPTWNNPFLTCSAINLRVHILTFALPDQVG